MNIVTTDPTSAARNDQFSIAEPEMVLTRHESKTSARHQTSGLGTRLEYHSPTHDDVISFDGSR